MESFIHNALGVFDLICVFASASFLPHME